MDFLNIPIYEHPMDEFMKHNRFVESCKDILTLDVLLEEVDEIQKYYEITYLSEALEDTKTGLKNLISRTIRNTRKTTKGVIGTHSMLTNSLANVYGHTYNLVYLIQLLLYQKLLQNF